MSKPTPAVVFVADFDYNWHIGSGDFLDYMKRPEAFMNKYHKYKSDIYYDYLDYMKNDEKSFGLFNATIDKFSDQDIYQMRKQELKTQEQDLPQYKGVSSFDNNFLIENGLMSSNGKLNYKKLQEYARKSMNALISTSKKLDNDNVYWVAAVHVNTDNVHVHYKFLEHEKRENRRKKYRDGDSLELEAFDKFKTTMVNSITRDNKMFRELTQFQREFLLPSVKETFPQGTVDLLSELVNKLPKDKQWQYNRPKIKKYQTDIDDCVMSLIKSNPKTFDIYNKYRLKLNEAVEKLKQIYGTGKEERRLYENFKGNHLKDFHQRAGNALLNFLKEDTDFYEKAIEQCSYSKENFDNMFIPEQEDESLIFDEKKSDVEFPIEDFSPVDYEYEYPQDDFISEQEDEPLISDEKSSDVEIPIEDFSPIDYEYEYPQDDFITEQEYQTHDVNIPDVIIENDTSDLISDGKYYLKWSDNYKEACSVIYDKNSEKEDYFEAEQLLLSEARSGNVLAIHDLGKLYSTEKLGNKDDEESFEYYKEALQGFMAIESYAENMFPYEPMYEGQSMKPKDMRSYVWYRIGKMHCYGLGTELNYEESFKWFLKSAEMKNKFAQYSLANLYYYGNGVEKDLSQAFNWYMKSAEQDQPYAAYSVAQMYSNGEAVHKDEDEAQKYYKQALNGFLLLEKKNQADDNLFYKIGTMYKNGLGTEINTLKAIDYFKQSAELNNKNGLYEYGKALFLGKDIPQDIDKAIQLLEKSINLGNTNAKRFLALEYISGKYLEQNIAKGIDMLAECVENGDMLACYNLGKIYFKGEVVEKDLNKAEKYFLTSAESENEFALYSLGKLYLEKEKYDLKKALMYLKKATEHEKIKPYADYSLGKTLYDKDIDRKKGLNHLLSASDENVYACTKAAKILAFDEEFLDIQKAIELLKYAIDTFEDNSMAKYYMGKILYDKDIDKESGLNHLLSASDENVYACTKAAKILAFDEDFLDMQKAVGLLKYAIDTFEDNSMAKYYMGKILYDKDIDKESGLNHLLSASDENVYACTKAAKILAFDEDFLDMQKAVGLLEYAIDNFEDNTTAKSMLGSIYLNNKSLHQEKAGLILLDEASEAGDEFAQQCLGKYYIQDKHKDLNKALLYLYPSAETGNAFSQYYIGKIYLSKEKRDIKKAKQFLHLSTQSGNEYAEYTLGCIYLKEGNKKQAKIFLKSSASHGNTYAKSLYKLVNSGKYNMKNKHHAYLRPSLAMLRRFYDSVNGHTKHLINQLQYEIDQKAEYDKLVEQQQIEYDMHRNY